jgi:hypothetical protein
MEQWEWSTTLGITNPGATITAAGVMATGWDRAEATITVAMATIRMVPRLRGAIIRRGPIGRRPRRGRPRRFQVVRGVTDVESLLHGSIERPGADEAPSTGRAENSLLDAQDGGVTAVSSA